MTKPIRLYQVFEETRTLHQARVAITARAVDQPATIVHLKDQRPIPLGTAVTLERDALGGLVFVPQTPPPEAEKAIPGGSIDKRAGWIPLEEVLAMEQAAALGADYDPPQGRLDLPTGRLDTSPGAPLPKEALDALSLVNQKDKAPEDPPGLDGLEDDDAVAFPPG